MSPALYPVEKRLKNKNESPNSESQILSRMVYCDAIKRRRSLGISNLLLYKCGKNKTDRIFLARPGMYHVIQTRSVGNETTAWEELAEGPELADAGRVGGVAWVAGAVGAVEDGKKSPAWEAGQTSGSGIGAAPAHIGVEADTAEGGEAADIVVDIAAEVEVKADIAVGTGPAVGAAIELELEAEVAAATEEAP